MRHSYTALLAAAALAISATCEAGKEADATLVLYNANDESSRALARYYGTRRGIPESRQIGLDCPQEEEISRDTFLVHILAPLRRTLTQNGWWKIAMDSKGNRVISENTIKFVAVMRGIPLKVRPDSGEAKAGALAPESDPVSPIAVLNARNEASVDSEIAALNALASHSAGLILNPYYRRFAPILDLPASSAPLLVCRIDGRSDADARRLIDDALDVEKKGLWGWAYLDATGTVSPGYKVGDDWLIKAGRILRRAGIPVIEDRGSDSFPKEFPATDAAVYFGWYARDVSGPFAKPDFRFARGAIAIHIHSFSAATLRAASAGWAAPLVAHGAAASAGNVYEPFLEFTIAPDVLQDRLLGGFTLGEAAYMASRALSWMGVVVGDPLYRPYQAWLERMPRDEDGATGVYQQYRSAIFAAGGDVLKAASALRTLAHSTGNSLFLEALAQAEASEGQFDRALCTLNAAAGLERDRTTRFRMTLEEIEILRRAGRTADARDRVKAACDKSTIASERPALERLLVILDSTSQPR